MSILFFCSPQELEYPYFESDDSETHLNLAPQSGKKKD